jgi:hydroxymethylbilane synthase
VTNVKFQRSISPRFRGTCPTRDLCSSLTRPPQIFTHKISGETRGSDRGLAPHENHREFANDRMNIGPFTMASTLPATGGDSLPHTITVGTRRSALALKQAEIVITALQKAHPNVNFRIQTMAVAGDRDKITPLPSLGKGLWTSELEAGLMSGELDMVVHSLKDMPTTLPEGCVLGCVTAREDPRDVVVFRRRAGDTSVASHRSLADLPAGSVVGTSSVRRTAQLRRRFPGLQFKDMRGNIDTRLRKLDAEDSGYDCIILAAAGLLRMGFEGRIAQYLDSTTRLGDGKGNAGVLHAVGQGGLGIETRARDETVLSLLKAIEDTATMTACTAERSVMRALEGGCSVPIGVETAWEEDKSGNKVLRLRTTVVSLDGAQGVDGDDVAEVASLDDAEAFGRKVAQHMVDKGAQKILDVINAGRVIVEPAHSRAEALGAV